MPEQPISQAAPEVCHSPGHRGLDALLAIFGNSYRPQLVGSDRRILDDGARCRKTRWSNGDPADFSKARRRTFGSHS